MVEQNGVSTSELKANEALASLMEVGRVHEQMGIELVELRNENDSLRRENGILRHDGERQAREIARLTLERDRAVTERDKIARLYTGCHEILRTAGSLLLDKAEHMKTEESGENLLAGNVERLRAVKTG